MEIFLAALLLVGLSVTGLCFNIIFRKNGKFPETEISNNKEMRKLGIRCAKEEELRLWGKKNGKLHPDCSDLGCSSCSASCSFMPEKEDCQA
ncbi:MAG: hypothetical protein IAB82_06395 [Bacteroidetes bacterium]|uniref:Uncharacterized protein n=1 Tax=Candidatus Cryptobacteroides faecavium TaxID=2840762 RepID=A0A9D9NFE7_9BACT|nr:hypothetical protein [Candidatus Cryptobacteroides faecavium]